MYDVIVVGAGHAGIEACLAPARAGLHTLLVTSHFENSGQMPCNTAIGGPAKGIIVREVDALGGQMGKSADANYTQMKMLNTAKGPGVWALRAQIDKITYPKYMQDVLKAQENLDIIESMVENLLVEDNKCTGIILEDGKVIKGKTVILTTGTYLKAAILVGDTKTPSGPDNERYSKYLSSKLEKLGFTIQRLKTGTPPRVAAESIDYTQVSEQPGTDAKIAFSYETRTFTPIEDQDVCWLTYTNEETHKIIRDNLHRSSMYSGIVKGVGPRYCPSIEDKIVKFASKERHQIFLEPESRYTNSIYVQGFSTSLPHDVQEKMIRTLPGLEHCKILKYAYAIEYDAIDPMQLKPSLETKLIENLFTAGQINGTSGYEEAAGQGLMAGINAIHKVKGENPLILKRNEAYLGVLIDDLVTKGTEEPYRMLTSRAEYRLLLRHDNADERLRKYGHEAGLVSKKVYDDFLEKTNRITQEIKRLDEIKFTPKSEINDKLEQLGSTRLKEGITATKLIERPEVTYQDIQDYLGETLLTDEEMLRVNIEVKYKGYIEKTLRQVEKSRAMEEKQIPLDIDYSKVTNLSIEAKEKLQKIRPFTVGQASRISGVNPADISVLLIYLKSEYGA